MNYTNVYLTDTRKYKCDYCKKKYIPNRRRVQKYCSASCRSKAFHKRKTERLNNSIKSIEEGLKGMKSDNYKPPVNKIGKMSVAGAGNAAVGALAANLITKALTPEENMPATRGDISRLETKLNRYHRVINIPSRLDGSKPYYDKETKMVIYSKNIY